MIVVELRDALDTDNTKAVGTSGNGSRDVDAAECIQEIAHDCRRNSIKLINKDDHLLIP